MITQFVMISTVILLILTGKKFFQENRKTKYRPILMFGLGLFLIAFGIFCYAIRDIVFQLGMENIHPQILKLGGFVHFLGNVLILWFICNEFTRIPLLRYVVFILLGIFLFAFFGLLSGRFFVLKSQIQQAPLEPFKYLVVRNYFSEPLANTITLVEIIIICLLIFGIMLYHSLREKDKKLRTKGFFYMFGVLFLVVSMLICMFISPIFARIGYLIGAILIFQATKMKV